jgi:hypothetical protein
MYNHIYVNKTIYFNLLLLLHKEYLPVLLNIPTILRTALFHVTAQSVATVQSIAMPHFVPNLYFSCSTVSHFFSPFQNNFAT